jgi:ATP-dependent protease ClpP protease subunit
MKLRTLLCIVFLIGYATSSIAEITLTDSTLPFWDIQGVITKSDLKELERAVEIMSKTKSTPYFRLNSEGGDVEVAIAIGRQLRRFQAQAITFNQGKCYSSCVFILAGAVRRSLSDSIGIHRPYSSSTDQRDYQATQVTQRRLAKLVKDYLEEMNVSPSLYDAMVAIPPEKMRLLSQTELERYGLLEVDPVQQELEDAAEARKYNLSKVDYLTKKSEVTATCARELRNGSTAGDFTGYVKCRDSVFRSKK